MSVSIFCYAVSVQSLWTINIKQWQSFNSVLQDMVTDTISAELIQMMDSLCEQRGITTDHFINFTFEVVDDSMFSVIGITPATLSILHSKEV